MTKESLITVRAAAARLSISQRKLYREISIGRFPPPLKVGRKSLVSDSDVTAYIQKLKAERGRV